MELEDRVAILEGMVSDLLYILMMHHDLKKTAVTMEEYMKQDSETSKCMSSMIEKFNKAKEEGDA